MSRRRASGAAAAVLVVVALAGAGARAHPGLPPRPHDVWLLSEWPLEPGVVASFVAAAALYARGARRLFRRAGAWCVLSRRRVAAFVAGWLVCGVALLSPLHRLGEALFSAHMAQHTLLLLVAAPLLALSRAGTAFLWALPLSARRAVGSAARRPAARSAWRALAHPLSAFWVSAVVLWGWHWPGLYQATLSSDAVHAAQHASFLGAALLFWHVVHQAAGGAARAAFGVLLLFTTAVHESLLGALLTFSSRPLYPAYAGRTEPFGLTLLQDQQIGGLVMWVPGGVVRVGAALVLFAIVLRSLERARAAGAPTWAQGGLRRAS